MKSEDRDRMELAFSSQNPPGILHEFAMELSQRGMARKDVYSVFREMFDLLEEEGREVEQGHVELILDSITHFMSPSNPLYLDLPE